MPDGLPTAVPITPPPAQMEARPTPRAVDRSYHPKGYVSSATRLFGRQDRFLLLNIMTR